MLKYFFKQYLYVQLSPNLVIVRDPKNQETIAELPEVAIQYPATPKARILAIGSSARGAGNTPDTSVINPFAHPRSLVSDFTVAEQVLKAFFYRVRAQGLFKPSPVVIMHPLGEHSGGLTQIELRAMREMAFGAGASEVYIWQGTQLTDDQILSGDYPVTGRMSDS